MWIVQTIGVITTIIKNKEWIIENVKACVVDFNGRCVFQWNQQLLQKDKVQ